MMDNFTFKNMDTNVDISVPIKEKIIYIYGGNGTGKTTFSKQFSEKVENSKVFNVDFVSKNVYIVDSDGAKTDPTTKDNFSKLFISQQAVQFATEMIKCKDLSKTVEQLKVESIKNINLILSSYKLDSNFDMEVLFKTLKTSRIDFNYKENVEFNKNQIEFDSQFETSIESDINLNVKITQYRSNDIMVKIHESMSNNQILKEIFIDNTFIKSTNEIINQFNTTIESIRKIETDFSKSEDPARFKKWIEDGVPLHSNRTDCLFCGTKNIEISLLEWKNLIDTQKNNVKNLLLKKTKEAKEGLQVIISNKNVYEAIIPLIIATTDRLFAVIENIESNANRNLQVEKIDIIIEKDLDEIKIETAYNEILAYILNKDLINLFFPYFYSEHLKNEQNRLEKLANIESDKFANSTLELIMQISKRLGLDKELKISTEIRKGSTPKLSVSPADKNIKIGTFSEGQRHKLALAIFFAEILLRDEILDFIVLDDPMLSLDVVTYHKLKSFIILHLKDKYKQSIILTHNISFLLIMLSNLIREEDKSMDASLLELKPKECIKIPIVTIAKDDIILLKEAIDNSLDINDISIWYWMIEKIARYMMDIKLSILGHVSFSDVNKDLGKIFTEEKLIYIKKIHSQMTRTSKSTKSKFSDIQESLQNLNLFCTELGFPEIINSVSITRLCDKVKADETVLINPIPRSLEFSIIKEGHTIVFNEERENSFLKGYIMHPRHQITESLVAFESKIDR